jgi:hypothetical protein
MNELGGRTIAYSLLTGVRAHRWASCYAGLGHVAIVRQIESEQSILDEGPVIQAQLSSHAPYPASPGLMPASQLPEVNVASNPARSEAGDDVRSRLGAQSHRRLGWYNQDIASPALLTS